MPASAYVENGRGIAEVIVPRSVEAVFDYVSDLRHLETWWPEHQVYRRLYGDGGRGTIYAWAMRRGPVPFAPPFAGLTIVTFRRRATRFAYRILAPGLLTRMTYDFSPTAGGTHVALESRSAAYRLAFFARRFPAHVTPALDTLAETLAMKETQGT